MVQTLTVIVSTDCANQAEELNHPAEAVLHLKNKHTRQDLGKNKGSHSGWQEISRAAGGKAASLVDATDTSKPKCEGRFETPVDLV